MNVFLRVDINIVAIVMLLLVHFLAYRLLERQDSLNKLFMRVSNLIIHQLFIETLTCIINRRPEAWLIPISQILHMFLFGIAPILTCYWFFLIRKIIFPNEKIFQKYHYLLILPVCFNTVISILSPFFHLVYYIDGTNVYHRGPLFLLSSGIGYSYIIFGLILILFHKNKIPRHEFTILVVFNSFPICGGMIQTLFYGPLLIWSCSAFSLVISYIFLQQRMVHLDFLTGAWDRGSFEYYISQRLLYNNKKFGIIYVDVDKLKDINDNYGHLEGDNAIKMAVSIMRCELNQNDFIVRLGGDEFLIIIDCDNGKVLNHMIERMDLAFESYNIHSSKRYNLECSFGGDIFDPAINNMEQFIHHIDMLMYQDKSVKR